MRRKRAERALLALWCALSPAGACAEGNFKSLRALVEDALPIARQWSPDAKLYAAYGRGPRNEERWEVEEWGLIFGDPKTKDGSFHIIYDDGVVKLRQGIKGNVKMLDEFKNGQFQGRQTAVVSDYSNSDYGLCRPVDPQFADTSVLEKLIHKKNLPGDPLQQYRFVLFKPFNDLCDGLGRHSLFLSEKPIPPRLMKRSLWVIHTAKETIFLDAHTAKILLRRGR
jgi:hypothetical protein